MFIFQWICMVYSYNSFCLVNMRLWVNMPAWAFRQTFYTVLLYSTWYFKVLFLFVRRGRVLYCRELIFSHTKLFSFDQLLLFVLYICLQVLLRKISSKQPLLGSKNISLWRCFNFIMMLNISVIPTELQSVLLLCFPQCWKEVILCRIYNPTDWLIG